MEAEGAKGKKAKKEKAPTAAEMKALDALFLSFVDAAKFVALKELLDTAAAATAKEEEEEEQVAAAAAAVIMNDVRGAFHSSCSPKVAEADAAEALVALRELCPEASPSSSEVAAAAGPSFSTSPSPSPSPAADKRNAARLSKKRNAGVTKPGGALAALMAAATPVAPPAAPTRASPRSRAGRAPTDYAAMLSGGRVAARRPLMAAAPRVVAAAAPVEPRNKRKKAQPAQARFDLF